MIGKDFPGRGKVAIVRTTPETVLDDYSRLMRLAGCDAALPKEKETILKPNISWQTWYPASSSTPWQIEGVIRTLQQAGYSSLIAAQNRTPLVDAYIGERNNKHKDIIDAYGVRNVHLYEPLVQWVRYQPKTPMLVLDKIFPEGILLPELFMGRNMVHLPTVKTHVLTTITGAMKNALGGLLHEQGYRTHALIHEALVDLLAIQKEIHAGLFAVMDGTFAGDGAGPRAMRWHEKGIILASADQVAIDAISAKLQGFDPMSIPFISMAHEMGLGVGDPRDIEVLGEDISGENWGFVQEETLASRTQKAFYFGPLKPLEGLLGSSPFVHASTFASKLYYDVYWYPLIGRERTQDALKTPWGRRFQSYGDGRVVMPGPEPHRAVRAAGLAAALIVLAGLLFRRRRD